MALNKFKSVSVSSVSMADVAEDRRLSSSHLGVTGGGTPTGRLKRSLTIHGTGSSSVIVDLKLGQEAAAGARTRSSSSSIGKIHYKARSFEGVIRRGERT